MSNTPTDNAWLDELIDKYRADIMLAAQGMNSDNGTYRGSAINVAALSSINIKDEIRRHIDTVCREAKDEVLDELLEWYHFWEGMHGDKTFNWYGAVKALKISKDFKKPFNTLEPHPPINPNKDTEL